ncbi:hypothetical protein [Listeria booriae]|uniref:Uncharacterized protein n=1 Tax=Listeria booriae TaxID=1552123 RepID=A0A7X0XEU9_9LIST|nr:hypothetical protein [Listeria booriae]MBC1228611.1 hypothetical protein [Listeria booriae]MBC1248122.1 hypothetical protein [Listeria booriae]MBC1492747.1 hypothetical protein [Listeria booriae]MBC1899066.1 hypothetical protein [Listeria booriae]MBC2069303.1 hypothetical protein [Listeria booriae]
MAILDLPHAVYHENIARAMNEWLMLEPDLQIIFQNLDTGGKVAFLLNQFFSMEVLPYRRETPSNEVNGKSKSNLYLMNVPPEAKSRLLKLIKKTS